MKIPFACSAVKLTSPYGERVLNGIKEFHHGYDLVGIGSDTVVSITYGVCVESRIITDKTNLTWQWGNYVCIRDYFGNLHYYCHLKERLIKKGDVVSANDKIGIMGNTGYTFGAHLHYECRKGNISYSPEVETRIPNAIGEYYNTIADDLAVLKSVGIINTMEYWVNHYNDLLYLPDLIHNMANYLRGNK